MSRGFPSMTALLGLLAVAGYRHRDKIAEMLGGIGQSTPTGRAKWHRRLSRPAEQDARRCQCRRASERRSRRTLRLDSPTSPAAKKKKAGVRREFSGPCQSHTASEPMDIPPDK